MQTYHHRWSTVCLTKTAFNANSHVVKQVLRESGSRSPNCPHRTGKAILMGRMAPKHKYGSYRSLSACSVKHTLLYHLYAMHHHILSFPGDEDTGPEPLDLADGVRECEEDRAKRIMDDEADLMKEKCHRVRVRVGGRERERWFWRIGFPKKIPPFFKCSWAATVMKMNYYNLYISTPELLADMCHFWCKYHVHCTYRQTESLK